MITSRVQRIPTLFFLFSLVLSGCVGYTPPVILETESPPVLITARPTRTATATRPPNTSTPSPSPAPVLGLNAESIYGETIRFWYVQSVGEEDYFLDLVGEFNRSNPWRIRVETSAYEDSTTIVEEVRASIYGELPDLVAIYPFQAAQLNSNGNLLTDLTPYLHDRDWGFSSQEIQDFSPQFWEQDIQEGKRLGIPFYRLAQVFFYNETWAKELGFAEPPKTPDEFREQICTAARTAQVDGEVVRGSGGWAIDPNTASLAGWIYAFGGEIFSQKEQKYRFDAPETRRAFVFLKELVDDGCAWVAESTPLWEEFAARKALVIGGSTRGLSAQNTAMSNVSGSDRWTTIPFPSLEGQPVFIAYGPSLAIVKSTPERQFAAWLFLKWLIMPENQADLVRASGALPVRVSALKLLEDYRLNHPQWASVVDVLPYAHVEPGVVSWRTVRLVLSDAGEEFFSPTFNVEAIPDLLSKLQATSEEIHEQFR